MTSQITPPNNENNEPEIIIHPAGSESEPKSKSSTTTSPSFQVKYKGNGCLLLFFLPICLLCSLMGWLLFTGRFAALLILIAIIVGVAILIWVGFLSFINWYGKKKRGEI